MTSTTAQAIELALTAELKNRAAGDPGAGLRLDVSRQLHEAIASASMGPKGRVELDEPQVLALLQKERAKRLESSRIYAEAGEQDRADREADEAAFIAAMLPREPSEAEVRREVRRFLAGTSDRSPKVIGQALAAVREALGPVDGKLASSIVKQEIS